MKTITIVIYNDTDKSFTSNSFEFMAHITDKGYKYGIRISHDIVVTFEEESEYEIIKFNMQLCPYIELKNFTSYILEEFDNDYRI